MTLFAKMALALAAGLALWQVSAARLDLSREELAHARTQAELTAAHDEARRWRLAAGENLLAAEAQKTLAEACLTREAAARTDADARAAILGASKPRPRPTTEKRLVVDDETRSRAVSRLNRGL